MRRRNSQGIIWCDEAKRPPLKRWPFSISPLRYLTQKNEEQNEI